jgi:hypothetical protein
LESQEQNVTVSPFGEMVKNDVKLDALGHMEMGAMAASVCH